MLKRTIIAAAVGWLLAASAPAAAQAQRVWIVVHPSELGPAASAWSDYRRKSGWSAEDLDLGDVR